MPEEPAPGLNGPLDAVVFDVGGTLVAEAAPATPVGELVPVLRPRVAEDLAALAARYRLAAATNTAAMLGAEVHALLSRTAVGGLLEVVVSSCDVGAAKPDPTVLLAVLRHLGVEPGRALYIGDRVTDGEAAAAGGMGYVEVGPDGILAAVGRWCATAPHG